MTQIGEGVAVSIDSSGSKKCIFCGEDHQDEEPESPTTFGRDMNMLKKEGRKYTIENYSAYYPGTDKPPLVEWEQRSIYGYKAAAHHCIALCTLDNHPISGELKAAGYDPNRGSNCSWLPYSKLQFVRARAYNRPLQKHRGGHTKAYFDKVEIHVEKVVNKIEEKFCFINKKATKDKVLRYMENQEKAIWLGLANPVLKAYHLYNHSYLDPGKPWGAYEQEAGKTKSDVLGHLVDVEDDQKAESDSADDPENIVL